MENNKTSYPEKSAEQIVIDDSSKNESRDSYYPDFSDIYDDSYEFWDFLHSKKERNESHNREEKRHQKSTFIDFLCPSTSKAQNDILQSEYESNDSAVTTTNDSRIYLKSEHQLHYQNKKNVGTVSNLINRQPAEKKLDSSDEEFWDFLSSNSPVVTFKELLQNHNSTNDEKECDISSFVSRGEESPFPSISEYLGSEGYGTFNSSPSSVSVRTFNYQGSENEMEEYNSRQSSVRKDSDEQKQTVDSTHYKSYIDVLKYLQQECIVSNRGVNVSSIRKDNNCFYENSSHLNSRETEKCQKNSGITNNNLNKFNQKHIKQQDLNQIASNKSQLHISSSQRPVYDGTVPILSYKYNVDDSKKDDISNTMNSFNLNNQQIGTYNQLVNSRRPTKRFRRNIPNRSVASHFNTAGNSKIPLTTSHLNAIKVVNFNQPMAQKSFANLKSENYRLSEHDSQSSSTSRVNQFAINPIVTNYTTPTIAVTGSNTTPGNSVPNSTPLYFLMPTNSETLQNPNYSHFFLLINNNNNSAVQMNQPIFIPNSGLITGTTNLKSTPMQSIPVLQTKVNSDILTKSGNVSKQNGLVVDQLNHPESSATASKSLTSSIKYQTIPQVYLPYTSLINSTDVAKQVNVQYSNKIPSVSNNVTIPVSVNNLVSSSKVSSTIPNILPSSVSHTHFYSTEKKSRIVEQKSNTNVKAVQSKFKQPFLKPLKNIPLGKDKYAIQQISTPVPICGREELNDSLGCDLNFSKINESPSLGNVFFENKLAPRIDTSSSHTFVNNISNVRDTLPNTSSKNFLQHSESYQSINSSSVISYTGPITPESFIGKNMIHQEESQTSAGNSTNVNPVPVSQSLETNKNIPSENNIQLINTNGKGNASSINLNTASNLVPIKIGNSQNKSLATLQELFPPPISMFPVRVLPQTQDRTQAITSQVLILNGNGKEQTVSHKLRIDPIPNRERSMSKKAKEKLKKERRKTVRELLQERRKSSSNQSKNNHRIRKEVRVLKPVLRLSTCDVCPNKSSPIIATVSKVDTTVINNDSASADSRKRPNILVLPSSSKAPKKSCFTEEEQSFSMKEQDSQMVADSTVSENIEDSLSSFSSSTLDRKDTRPRHYDMSQLNIGDFRVDDDIDSCGRFRSKFKVIFSKRLFYYDFPVSRCNQFSLKSTDVWEQMARIAVPFKTVVSMSLNERTIEISINTPPTIALGRLQVRTGIIPNSTMYDTAVESDCLWGCMIRSSFHHKIILRKKQASKLKSFLCHFDDRFLNIINVGPCESGLNNVDELSIFDGELSPTTLKQNVTKKSFRIPVKKMDKLMMCDSCLTRLDKKHYIRRLSQWDFSDNEDQKTVDEDDMVLLNQMCSCRVSCRSIRCSCVKAAKSCNSVCDCINCDNPLNILETLGMNLDFSLSDSCLFQNIYQIPKLIPFLTKEVKLTCCNTFARVQDCIPGTVLCPNVDCNVPLEFSWCKKIVCYPERNPRNHCSFCGQCCFSNGRHCMTCNRCYVATSKSPCCPTCQEKTTVATLKDMESNCFNCETKDHDSHLKFVAKQAQKPEIVILDVFSVPKTSTNIENADGSIQCESTTNHEDYTYCKDSSDCDFH